MRRAGTWPIHSVAVTAGTVMEGCGAGDREKGRDSSSRGSVFPRSTIRKNADPRRSSGRAGPSRPHRLTALREPTYDHRMLSKAGHGLCDEAGIAPDGMGRGWDLVMRVVVDFQDEGLEFELPRERCVAWWRGPQGASP